MSASSTGKPKFDPSNYPRTYKSSVFSAAVDAVWKGSLLTLLLIGWYRYALWENEGTDIFLFFVFVTVALLGLLYALALFRTKVVLNPDAIIVQGATWPKKISRENIAGICTRMIGSQKHIELKLKRPLNKTFAFQMPCEEDAHFGLWFSGIKNLDADHPARESTNDEQQDVSLRMRIESFARAKTTISIALFLSPIIGMAWALIYPHPYGPVVGFVAALPWIAIVLMRVFENFLTAGKKSKRKARPELSLIALAPGFVLSMRALTDVNLIDPTNWERMIYLTLGGSVLMVLIALTVAPILRKQLTLAIPYAVIMIPYVWSVLTISNQYFDYSAPMRQSLDVTGKHVSHNRRRGNDYYLTLQYPDSYDDSKTVAVNRRLFAKLSTGDSVCLSRYRGAFDFGWQILEKRPDC